MNSSIRIKRGECSTKGKSRLLDFEEDDLDFDVFDKLARQLYMDQEVRSSQLRHKKDANVSSDKGKQSVDSNWTESTVRERPASSDATKTLRMKLDLTKELVDVLSDCIQELLEEKCLSRKAVLNSWALSNAQRSLRGAEKGFFLKQIMKSEEMNDVIEKAEKCLRWSPRLEEARQARRREEKSQPMCGIM